MLPVIGALVTIVVFGKTDAVDLDPWGSLVSLIACWWTFAVFPGSHCATRTFYT